MRIKLFIFFLILLSSCSSKKDIIYFQDLPDTSKFDVNYKQYLINSDDILKIEINGLHPEFGLNITPIIPNNSFSNSSSKEVFILKGYQVDYEGFITLPVLGKFKAADLSIEEFRNNLTEAIINSKILTSAPSVDVKLLNNHFTILGEVNQPGRYDFLDNNLNLLEAIGFAGDLTINGVRSDVKILRQNDQNVDVITVDLTSSKFINTGIGFQILPGDIIIVNPNRNRVKNAGIIGNSGTLLSLLSFLLTSFIILSSN